jgi:DNA mismatch repair ATPase MutS
VIDELGRGTSNSEGLAIAWSTAEFLAEFANVYTLFATHFLQIDALAKLYPNVRCYNMAVAQDVARKRFTMLHRMSEGSAKHEDYLTGMLAETAGIPATVIERAREIAASLEESTLSSVTPCNDVDDAQVLGEKCLNLRFSTLGVETIQTMLRSLQAEARALSLAMDDE